MITSRECRERAYRTSSSMRPLPSTVTVTVFSVHRRLTGLPACVIPASLSICRIGCGEARRSPSYDETIQHVRNAIS
jgi:hypothetical protein